MVRRGKSVKGTRYSSAGCAALKTSDDTVAVSSPVTSCCNACIKAHSIPAIKLVYTSAALLVECLNFAFSVYHNIMDVGKWGAGEKVRKDRSSDQHKDK